MKLCVGLLVFCAIAYVSAGDNGSSSIDGSHSVDGILGFGLELILTKLGIMASKLQKMEDKLQTMEHQMLQQNRNQEKVDAALLKLDRDVERVLQKQDSHHPYSSCKQIPSNVTGTYLIRLNSAGVSVPIRVYCEQRSFGGGWIVIQHRFDGSLDFYRDWNEFRDGFGVLEKEFWLGLELMHQITRAHNHELIVELKDFSGEYKYARYDAFEIGSEDEGYVLKKLGEYSGTAGDSMFISKDERFSTKDRDNDQDSRHCAQESEGAWWYYECAYVNLNGRYMNAEDMKSMYWKDFKGRRGLSFSRMMIR